MSVNIITCLNKIKKTLINCSLLIRDESQNVMLVDAGNHLIKLYMDPIIISHKDQYKFLETIVIGLILRDQFPTVKI